MGNKYNMFVVTDRLTGHAVVIQLNDLDDVQAWTLAQAQFLEEWGHGVDQANAQFDPISEVE